MIWSQDIVTLARHATTPYQQNEIILKDRIYNNTLARTSEHKNKHQKPVFGDATNNEQMVV